jgi:(2R)-sulfolactate sulfo-lyase subunit alpha
MTTHFIVHDKADTVGVVVVEDVKPGMELTGWVMENAIPLGHKIALKDLGEAETVLKYGADIGVTRAQIGKGRHVHVQNMKTKRW